MKPEDLLKYYFGRNVPSQCVVAISLYPSFLQQHRPELFITAKKHRLFCGSQTGDEIVYNDLALQTFGEQMTGVHSLCWRLPYLSPQYPRILNN